MYAPTQQYGSPPPVHSPPGGASQYRASPGQHGTPRQAYAAPGYQQAMYQQQVQAQAQQQARYPAGYAAPGVPVQGMPMQMVNPGQYQQQQAFYAQQQQQQQQQHAPQGVSRRQQHKGTIPPGQMVRIGNNAVRVERYLSEGGYAHVYLTTSESPVYPPKDGSGSKGRWGEKGYTEHCLKRIAFDDEKVWADVSKEIEVMKALPRSPYLVQYLDSSHHRLPNGTHEVFILMEYCGGIIDLLNKRLRDRLKEIEILNIFTDVCEAVAAMHALPRPLLHRDLKIENVLSNPTGQAPTQGRPTPLIFKLCDFGSTTFPATHPPTTKAEADALAMDLNKHTTLQYRSPEMVEPMLGWPVGLPSDVWALGVLLYKLCYYTTPFEEHGTLAIVNAKYTFPQYPVYSPRLQHLIASMLVEHPSRRPSVFDVLRVAHEMSGTKPLVDYPPSNRQLPATIPSSPVKAHRKQPSNANVLDFTDSGSQTASAPEPSLVSTVTPQRRGRPTKVQPPPPQLPPATVTPAPVPIKPGQSEQFRQPHVPSSALHAAKPTRLQVTGELTSQPAPSQAHVQPAPAQAHVSGNKHRPSPSLSSKPSISRMPSGGPSQQRPTSSSRQSSVDAFGAPKAGQATSPGVTSPTGSFGDAFGVTLRSTRSPASTGFGDSFTGGKSIKSPVATGFGDSFTGKSGKSAGSSGFGDSFTGSKFTRPPPPTLPSGFGDSFTGKVLEPSKPVSSKQATPTSPKEQKDLEEPKEVKEVSPASTSSRKLDPASSIPDGELSFEKRFPSLEELQGGSTSAQGQEKIPKAGPSVPPKTASAAATKAMRRPSLVIANHTGGDFAPSIRSPKVAMNSLPPQPRSTHVTGTAFKATVQAPAEASGDGEESGSATANYLSLLDEDVPPPPMVDLMGDEESESMKVALAPLRPVLSNTPSSGGRYGVSPTPQEPAKPPPVARKPETLSAKSDAGKPQGAAQRATLPDMSAERPPTNFNSEQWSPLEKMRTASTRSPVSPTRDTKHLLDDSSDDEAHPENANGSRHRPISPVRRAPPSPGIAKRMSWFEPGSPSLASPVQPTFRHGSVSPGSRPQSMYASGSPLTAASPNLPRSHSPMEHEGHSRRGSINDIVSRYEALSTRKPAVAAKPANLTGSHTGNFGGSSGKTAPSVPSKPQMLRKPSGGRPMPTPSGGRPMPSNGGGLRRASTINIASRPPTQPKPAALKAKSESVPPVPALPVIPPSPSDAAPPVKEVKEEALAAPRPQAQSTSASTSRSSSPEKQQPVNLLIARWNKGHA